MAEFATKGEFAQLATRVDVLEREVEGEKLVTRHILEQTRRNGDDLATIKTRLDRIEGKLDGVDLKGLVHRVDGLDRKLDDLTKNLSRMVADVMREVLRQHYGR